MKLLVALEPDETGMLIAECPASLSVPQHRELAPGTLRAMIHASGMSVDQFVDLL
jgi:hypothetical protein